MADELKYSIGFILEHDNEVWNCSERDYLINDVRNTKRLMAL